MNGVSRIGVAARRVSILAIGAVFCLGATASAQRFDAERHRLLPRAGWPAGHGDLDGDGDQDLVWGGSSGIAWNDGGGRFVLAGTLPWASVFGTSPIGSVVAADIDGDGDLDLANPGFWFGSYIPSQLLRNDGPAGFTNVSSQWVTTREAPLAVEFVDWDGDGDLDLVTCNAWSRSIYQSLQPQPTNRIYRNDGAGTFSDVGLWPNAVAPNSGMAIGDVDGDGDPDVVVSSRISASSIYVGPDLLLYVQDAQHVAVATPGRFAFAPGFVPDLWGVALSDHDLDGDLDVAVAATSAVLLFRNDGTGTFAEYDQLDGPAKGVIARDFDGDQRVDLLVHDEGSLFVAMPSRLLRNTPTGFVDVSATHLDAAANAPRGLVFDVDGDGDLDLVRAAQPQAMLWHNDGQGRLLAVTDREPGNRVATRAMLVDLDQDGDLDAATLEEQVQDVHRLVVTRNDGRGLEVHYELLVPPGPELQLPTWFDFDGDGDLDAYVGVVSSFPQSSLHARLFRNDGQQWTDVTGSGMPIDIASTRAVAAADFDGDGRDDIVTTRSAFPGPNRRLLLSGPGGLQDHTALLPASVPDECPSLAVLDFDGDGRVDIAFGSDLNTGVRLLRNDLPNGFTDVTAAWLPQVFGRPLAIDVDRDGRQDLLCIEAGAARIFRQVQGQLVDETAARIPVPPIADPFVRVQDFDGDGWQDVVVAKQPWFRNVGGVLQRWQDWPVVDLQGSVFEQAAFGDLDGDGDVDAVGRYGPILDRTRHLFVARPWRLGAESELVIQSYGGDGVEPQLALLWVAAAAVPQPIPVPGLGRVWLDPASAIPHSLHVFPGTGGEASIVCTTPSLPSLLGTVVFAQALHLHRPSTGELRTGNLVELRIRL